MAEGHTTHSFTISLTAGRQLIDRCEVNAASPLGAAVLAYLQRFGDVPDVVDVQLLAERGHRNVAVVRLIGPNGDEVRARVRW